jgi:ABC-type transport system substrate-binding protein
MLKKYLILFAAIGLLASCGKLANKSSEEESKKTFKYNQAGGLSSLDPAFARNQANIWATTQLYNGLFELGNDLFVHPSLVDTWSISDDGLSYTFHIKRGVLFHDSEVFTNGKGRELLAEDFVYSFKRIIDPATASTGAWIFNDKVLRDKTGNFSDTCFKATDNYTLKVYLNKPFPAFLHILSMPYAFVVPKEAIAKWGKDYRVHPVGTGPFKFDRWEENNSLIMLKNENYWRFDETGKKLPYLDAIQVSFISDKNQEFLTFQKGDIHFISGLQENSKDMILNKDGSIKREFKDKFLVQKVPYLNTEYIGIQMDSSKYPDKKHPLLDRRVRQALSYGINRKELVSYVMNNLGTPGTSGFIPAALPSFDKNKVKGYDYNPEKAATLLREAGYPEGKGLPTLSLFTTSQSKAMVEYLQKQWSKLGINVDLQYNQVATHQEMVDNGRVQFFRGSWLGDYPDAENYLSLFFSRNFSPSGPNKTHFKNAQYDELYDKAMLENDGWKRFEIYHQMDQIIMNECPVIVLFYDEVLRLTQNNIVGLETDAMNILKLERAEMVQGKLTE